MQKNLFASSSAVNCPRCGRLCRVATDGNQQARPMRKDLSGKGMCANCIVTEILNDEPFVSLPLPPGVRMTDALRMPHVQDQFARICQVGGAVDAIEEIDWTVVISNWDLPFPKRKRGRRR